MIAEAVIKAFRAVSADQFSSLQLLNADGTPRPSPTKITPKFTLNVAEEDLSDIGSSDTGNSRVLVAIDATLGIPLPEFGTVSPVTRTSAVTIQVVDRQGQRDIVGGLSEKLVDWLQSDAGQSGVRAALDGPQLLSLTVIDAVDDPEDNYERTTVTAEAVYVPMI